MYETPWVGLFQPFISMYETKASAARLQGLQRQDAEQWQDQMVSLSNIDFNLKGNSHQYNLNNQKIKPADLF